MATLEELVVQLTADTASLKAELQTAQKVVKDSTKKMDDAIKDFSQSSSKNVGVFEMALASASGFLASQAVTGAINVLKDSLAFLAGELMEAGKEAIKEEQVFNLLAASLAQTGYYSKQAADDLIQFTAEMEGLAGVSQDVIASNLALLSSLTRLDTDGLKAAQLSAINMSAALGKDLGSATEAVAKAINGNEGALGRMGIKLDLTADSAKNLEIVTGALNERFGTAAQARLNTFGGALFMLKDAYGDMLKELTLAVTKNEVFITVMNEVANVFQNVQKYIQENAASIRDGLGQALVSLLSVASNVFGALGMYFKLWDIQLTAMLVPVRVLIENLKMLGNTFTFQIGDAVKNVQNMGQIFVDLKDKVANVGEDNTLQVISNQLDTMRRSAQMSLDEMAGKSIEAATAQNNMASAVNTATEAMNLQKEALKTYVDGLADQFTAVDSQYKLQQQMLQEGLAQDLITQEEYFAELTAMRDQQRADELAKVDEALARGATSEQAAANAKLQINQQYALDSMKQMTALKAFEDKQNKARLDGYGTFFGGLASLSESSNRELAAIGKAAAISKATMDAYLAIQNALANVPFPANIAAAAGIGVQAFSNVAKIAGIGLKGGLTEVPRSAAGGNSGDNFPAVLKSGERVITSDQNKDLKEFMNNETGGKQVVFNVNILPNTGLNQEQIGDLVEQFNRYLQSGGLKLIGG